MEIYILDSLLRRTGTVVDKFESLIWTERLSSWGDFELKMHSDNQAVGAFITGTKLAMNESYRVMVVETVENETDSDGKQTLTVRGRSIELLMANRLARATLGSSTADTGWTITGTPGYICRKIFHDICVTGTLSTADIIPFIFEGTIFPEDTIAEPSTSITVTISPTSVYDAIKELCDIYDLGFRIVRQFDLSKLWFDVYSGSDRTSSQNDLPAVIFSPGMDNLQNTKELVSVADYKNVAYVVSPVGSETVVADYVDPAIAGFDRHVLFVDADDITDTVPATASAKMIQRGKRELAKNRVVSGFDGELNRNSAYIYELDYYLGDLVEMRSSSGATNTMQVTEQIFVSDAEGERSYPTLSINQFIMPGTWLAWDFNEVWSDMTTEHWADLP